MTEDLELREWIAVNLMGWEYDDSSTLTRPLFVQPDKPGDSYSLDGAGRILSIPAYESTYEGMGRVIEAMRAKGYVWVASWGKKGVLVSFAPTMMGIGLVGQNFKGEANTLPLAVARAAKAALSSQTEEEINRDS